MANIIHKERMYGSVTCDIGPTELEVWRKLCTHNFVDCVFLFAKMYRTNLKEAQYFLEKIKGE